MIFRRTVRRLISSICLCAFSPILRRSLLGFFVESVHCTCCGVDSDNDLVVGSLPPAFLAGTVMFLRFAVRLRLFISNSNIDIAVGSPIFLPIVSPPCAPMRGSFACHTLPLISPPLIRKHSSSRKEKHRRRILSPHTSTTSSSHRNRVRFTLTTRHTQLVAILADVPFFRLSASIKIFLKRKCFPSLAWMICE